MQEHCWEEARARMTAKDLSSVQADDTVARKVSLADILHQWKKAVAEKAWKTPQTGFLWPTGRSKP